MELCHRGLFPYISGIPKTVTSPAQMVSVLTELCSSALSSVWQPLSMGNAKPQSPNTHIAGKFLTTSLAPKQSQLHWSPSTMKA